MVTFETLCTVELIFCSNEKFTGPSFLINIESKCFYQEYLLSTLFVKNWLNGLDSFSHISNWQQKASASMIGIETTGLFLSIVCAMWSNQKMLMVVRGWIIFKINSFSRTHTHTFFHFQSSLSSFCSNRTLMRATKKKKKNKHILSGNINSKWQPIWAAVFSAVRTGLLNFIFYPITCETTIYKSTRFWNIHVEISFIFILSKWKIIKF